MVQKLCSEFNVHLTHVRPIQIYGPYVGDSEKILKRLFEEAMNQKGPSVLFLDEIVLKKIKENKLIFFCFSNDNRIYCVLKELHPQLMSPE